VSTNPERSRLARVASLLREAAAAEAASRWAEAAARLQEAARLDPRDRRTLQRLGDLLRARLDRPREAAAWYARAARHEEAEGFLGRAVALWRLVLRCDPASLEAHERVGALYAALGRGADARQHYEQAARSLAATGRAVDAAILRAHRAALDPTPEAGVPAWSAPAEAAPPARPAAPPPAEAAPDADALDLASDRLQSGRLFLHYGLHEQARQQLEELLASLPDHVEGRQLLVEACRALGDDAAAAAHLQALTRVMRERGVAPSAAWAPPPAEEWDTLPPPRDPLAELMGEIRADVERLVESLVSREEDR
jgi:tetratricopeptide (TPR) repeat protein